MSEPTFTSGPWDWCYDGSGTYSIGQANDPQADPPHVTIWDRDHLRAVGNASLISAAPELYEALELAQKWLLNCLPVGEITGPKPLPIIANILAKARGEK